MQPFAVRTLAKKELALAYFPKSNPRIAVRHLMGWIHKSPQLWNQLQATGYQANAKYFTPKQVALILDFLGEP